MWPARIGITIGPVAAGVIDTSVGGEVTGGRADRARVGRLWFDVWGDTLNVAARLAQTARPNQILTRERVLWEAGGLFEHGALHARRVKKHILPDCAEVYDIRPEFRDADGEPNGAFWEVYNSETYRPARPDPRGTLAALG
jgi:class 3 adenylate cyclase